MDVPSTTTLASVHRHRTKANNEYSLSRTHSQIFSPEIESINEKMSKVERQQHTPKKSPSRRSEERRIRRKKEQKPFDEENICWRPTKNKMPTISQEELLLSSDRIRSTSHIDAEKDNRGRAQHIQELPNIKETRPVCSKNVTTDQIPALELSNITSCTNLTLGKVDTNVGYVSAAKHRNDSVDCNLISVSQQKELCRAQEINEISFPEVERKFRQRDRSPLKSNNNQREISLQEKPTNYIKRDLGDTSQTIDEKERNINSKKSIRSGE